jgi:hypothetical protein
MNQKINNLNPQTAIAKKRNLRVFRNLMLNQESKIVQRKILSIMKTIVIKIRTTIRTSTTTIMERRAKIIMRQ